MPLTENPQSQYPKMPRPWDCIKKDGTPHEGYQTVDRNSLPEEVPLDAYLQSTNLKGKSGFVHSRTEPIAEGVVKGNMNGYKTIQFGASSPPQRIDHKIGECVMLGARAPIVLLQKEGGDYRLNFTGIYITASKKDAGEAYVQHVDAACRGGVLIEISLPFGSRNEALGFLKWLQSDLELRLKETITKCVPALAEWSRSWELSDYEAEEWERDAIKSAKKTPAKIIEAVRSQTHPAVEAAAAEPTQGLLGKMRWLFGGQ